MTAVAFSVICSAALEQVASTQALPGQGETPAQFVAQSTLEDWYYAFQHGGLEALKPKLRSDRGKPRRLSAQQQPWILERVRAFPGVPVKQLYRQWKQADPTLPVVYGWLEQNDLDAQGRRYLLRQNIPGPTKAFEAPGVNDRWIVDFSPGPFLALHPKTVATHLCVIIDDHSRLIPYAAYGLAADTQALLRCLKEAIRRRGLPRKLYADNGGPFINLHLKIVCANLGIRLIHSQAGRPWSRGKVERMFRTIQEDFEAGLRLPGQAGGSLEELNGKNGQEFVDYVRLMAFCGSRRDETLRIKWADVDWKNQQLTVGADGPSKNGKSRIVDFNDKLEAHLKDMATRRAPDSEWLFPSPQRGDRDKPTVTFKETLRLARQHSGLAHIGFHDLRHHFISFCVMSGVDFMTIAKSVGHQDAGILIGKVYGHLPSENTKAQARRIQFEPCLLRQPQA